MPLYSLIELDRVKYEDYLNIKPGERIYPPLDDFKCNCCKRHILELRPFGGPGDPLDGDFTGSLLVKTRRSFGPYVEEAEKAVRKAERCYKSDGYDNYFDWMIDEYGKEEADRFDSAHFCYHDSLPRWECRDCIVLDTNKYHEKLDRTLEQLG
jgi:hypothetical protein